MLKFSLFFVLITLLILTGCSQTELIPESSNNLLKIMTITGAELSEPFSPSITRYRITVSAACQEITVACAAGDSKAVIRINDQAGQTGRSSSVIPLTGVYSQDILIRVTAENGTSRKYQIQLTRYHETDCTMISFNLNRNLNNGISSSVSGDISGDTIRITMPQLDNLNSLKPIFSTSGVSVTVNSVLQQSGSSIQNFYQPLTYRVNAEDGSYRDYKVQMDIIEDPVIMAGPEDWRDEVIYNLIIDRFHDGDPSNNDELYHDLNKMDYYHGGDLKGIMDKADYLKGMGVTAVWISPVIKNIRESNGQTGYHGYWAQDLTKVDPHFAGSIREYRQFVDYMHSKGIRVIQDVVINHMGDILKYTEGWNPSFKMNAGYHRIFIEDEISEPWVLTGNRLKPTTPPFNLITAYHSNGEVKKWEDVPYNQMQYGDFPGGLDDLDTDSPEVIQALIEVNKNWISFSGVDGIRVDAVPMVGSGFWDLFSPALRAHARSYNSSARFLQFGEAFVGYHPYTTAYVDNSRLDSLMNFDLYFKLYRVFAIGKGTGLLEEEYLNRFSLRGSPVTGGSGLSAQNAAVNFIDNQDVDRFLVKARYEENPVRAVRQLGNALGYIMTANGIPCIYYDTENQSLVQRSQVSSFSGSQEIYQTIRDLTDLRSGNSSLRRGLTGFLKFTDPGDYGNYDEGQLNPGILAYVRYQSGLPGENILVVMNTADHALSGETLTAGGYFNNGTVLECIYPVNPSDTVTVSSGSLNVSLDPQSMKVYRIKN